MADRDDALDLIPKAVQNALQYFKDSGQGDPSTQALAIFEQQLQTRRERIKQQKLRIERLDNQLLAAKLVIQKVEMLCALDLTSFNAMASPPSQELLSTVANMQSLLQTALIHWEEVRSL